jgi:murein DD-endopeptidase MepM/ murein hydrolase activator NlpD
VVLVATVGFASASAGGELPAGPPGSTTTTSTTVPTSTTSTTTSPTVTVTVPGSSTTTTTLPGGDPFADELLESGHYASQPSFDPRSNEVAQAEVERAQRRLADAERAGERAEADVRSTRARLDELQRELGGATAEDRRLLRESEVAYSLFVDRVADAYMRGNDQDIALLVGAEDANELGKKTVLLESILEADESIFDQYRESRRAMNEDVRRLHDDLISATRDYKTSRVVEKEARAEIHDATIEVKMWEAGGQLFASGFIFPVQGEASFGDSWGAPRMTGTEYQHWHEGTDIMAPAGTPLVACEDGWISRTSSSTLGGISLYVRGESGIEYYYAHLSAYAPDVVQGTPVRAGDLVGYVGDTGNAKGGSPHLHFEIHGLDGRPVNPFPILRVAHETQAVLAAVGAAQAG